MHETLRRAGGREEIEEGFEKKEGEREGEKGQETQKGQEVEEVTRPSRKCMSEDSSALMAEPMHGWDSLVLTFACSPPSFGE
ncbi:MAG: hypothetical protein KJ000_01995 [Pirellulaceae bacterium]|nr:hypothetical protein [Pirellulaceae bacterium]